MSGPFDFIDVNLDELHQAGLRRRLLVSDNASEPVIMMDGKQVVQFASNNYLGLATHPSVVASFKEAADRFGVGAGSSRLLAGTQTPHEQLESALANFKGVDSALVFASGSMANYGALSALAEEGDLLLIDKLVHATIYDGAKLSGAEVRRFPHNDLTRLDQLLLEAGTQSATRKIIVVVDAVYSMDGDLAPLPDLLALTRRHSALLLVDEAHSTGVLGATGKGLFEHFNLLVPEHVIITGTLSKALGSLGGFVAGSHKVREWLVQRSRPFIFSTALPAACAAAAHAALKVLLLEPERLVNLRSRTDQAFQGLRSRGWNIGASVTPIIPVIIGSAAASVRLQSRLWNAGYYVPAIRPPTVAANACRLRMSVMATHSQAQIESFCALLGNADA